MDARSDVYSLGVTLYEILTLRTPFGGSSDHAIHNSILFEEPSPPRKMNPRLHRDLETIVLHALEKNPERRYGSAGALAADLRRFLRYEPIQARPQTDVQRLLRCVARDRGKVAAGATILLLAAAATVFAWKAIRPPRYVLVNQRPLTTDLDALTTEPTLSRDGMMVAYASDRGGKGNLDIWVEPVSGGSARQLTSHEADDREATSRPMRAKSSSGRTARRAGSTWCPDGAQLVDLKSGIAHQQIYRKNAGYVYSISSGSQPIVLSLRPTRHWKIHLAARDASERAVV